MAPDGSRRHQMAPDGTWHMARGTRCARPLMQLLPTSMPRCHYIFMPISSSCVTCTCDADAGLDASEREAVARGRSAGCPVDRPGLVVGRAAERTHERARVFCTSGWVGSSGGRGGAGQEGTPRSTQHAASDKARSARATRHRSKHLSDVVSAVNKRVAGVAALHTRYGEGIQPILKLTILVGILHRRTFGVVNATFMR